MPLTKGFKQTVLERAQRDSRFRIGLLTEALECLLNNEIDVAKSLLRDYVNATIGFQELGLRVDKEPSSLMRMLGPNGNPNITNLSQVIAAVRDHEGIRLKVRAS